MDKTDKVPFFNYISLQLQVCLSGTVFHWPELILWTKWVIKCDLIREEQVSEPCFRVKVEIRKVTWLSFSQIIEESPELWFGKDEFQ